MDFAPYQSSPPENARSPPLDGPTSPRASLDRRPFSPGHQRQSSAASPPPLQHPQPQRQWSGSIPSPTYYQNAVSPPVRGSGGGRDGYFGLGGDRDGVVSEFDTSLGIRLDYEACLAYLALPPLGAIVLLILERKSDYVRRVIPADTLYLVELPANEPGTTRFHAWQSALLFTVAFLVQPHLFVVDSA